MSALAERPIEQKAGVVYLEGRPEDMEALVELIEEMHEENGIVPLSIPKIRVQIKVVIRDGFVLNAWDGDRIVGSVGARIGPLWYSETPIIGDVWVFVRKSHRKGRTAIVLLKALRTLSNRLGIPLITGPRTPIEPERKNALYSRFFTPFGGSFTHGV